MTPPRLLITLGCLALLGSAAIADVINVPADYPTIQGAIDASSDGDVINIAAGTYNEHELKPGGKSITIQGTLNGDGSLATTIDAQQGGRVFVIESGLSDGPMIKNLMITGGIGNSAGGIYCNDSSSITISGCSIMDNNAAGVYSRFCNINIINCTISNNSGYGLYLLYNNITVADCLVTDNYRGISTVSGISTQISDCTISNNGMYGISCTGSPTINGCTITGNGNTQYSSGGVLFSGCNNPTMSDCTISGNTGTDGGGISCEESNLKVYDSTITGNTAKYGGGIFNRKSEISLIRGSVCGNIPDQIWNSSTSGLPPTSGLCWIADNCDDNPYVIINNQQEQINQLLALYAQQQSEIKDLQILIAACCAAKTCLGDANSDGEVSVNDILLVIAEFGTICP